ncbi:MAG: MFS transporter [Phototrophicales bacterium]|nr:MFS transporter [Phototrophicales bacterium]
MTSDSTTTPSLKKAMLSPWVIVLILCVPVFINSLDLTVVSAFLPELMIELQIPIQTGLADAAWIVSAYLLAYTVSLAFMGRVSDLAGRRIVYIVSLAIFMLGSYLVAVAHTFPTDWLYDFYLRNGLRIDPAYANLHAIIIARIIQAFGAGAITPASMALASDLFPKHKRAIVLGFIGAVDTLGWVLGHLYGGIFLQIPGVVWQDIFWINIPITLFALAITLWALRGVPMSKSKGRFDILGTIAIAGALICLSIGLGGVNIEVSGSTSLQSLADQASPFNFGLLGAGFGLFLLFILIESRIKDPIINLNLFKRRNVNMGLLANLLIGYCIFIGLVAVPILINIRQESVADIKDAALQVGLMLGAMTIPMAIATIPGGWLSEKIGYGRTIIFGMILSIIGFIWMWQTWSIDISDLQIVAQMIFIGAGIGFTFSPISAAVLNSSDEDAHGVASSLILIMRLVGMTISVTSLSNFAISRVNWLAGEQLAGILRHDPSYLQTYSSIAAGVLGELGLLGAIICGLAIIPALAMKNEDATEKNSNETLMVVSAEKIVHS